MKLLISHVNYPAQFRRLIPAWVSLGHEIVFIARQLEWHCTQPDGFTVDLYQVNPRHDVSNIHPYLRRLDTAISEGQETFRLALKLRNSGWFPDVIISHVGFGNGLFLKDCFPDAIRIGLAEWFYNSYDSDVDFLPPFTVSDDHKLQLRVWNAETLLEISSLDKIVVPTIWQRNQFPNFIRKSLNVIHEGVDIDHLSNLRLAHRDPPYWMSSDLNTQYFTYVSRTFEEYRGFPQVVKVISRLLDICPHLHFIMVGQDGTSYGSPRSDGISWSNWAKSNYSLDNSRVHWLGSLQEHQYHEVLATSDVHFYMTIPFILSWSLLEAMAAGCSIVASDTAPVQEVLKHDHSALLVDFYDTDLQVKSILNLLRNKPLRLRLASNARSEASLYSSQQGLNAWNDLISS